jgi:small GTP-binding protein
VVIAGHGVTRRSVDLSEIADRAQSLGGSAHALAVRDLAEFLRDERLRVVIFGEFSVGKSTLINALMGKSALPAKAMPTTGHVTRIRFGEREGVVVTLADGRVEFCPLEQLGSFVTLDMHSRAREGIDALEVVIRSPLLRDGLTLIDTPGINDAETQTRRAERAVMGADLVLLVLRANQMLGAEMRQRAAVWMARTLGKPVVPILNGLNQVEERDRNELRRLLAGWARATLAPALGKPFYEVNAIGALRHALNMNGAARPADDFAALKSALLDLNGKSRKELQEASRANQARAVLRSAAQWNQTELDGLERAEDELRRRRQRERDRLRHAIAGVRARLSGEDTHVSGLVAQQLQRGWLRLATRLATNQEALLKEKAHQRFDTYMEKAVRGAEEEVNERQAALAEELGAPPAEPLTVAQLISLNIRTEVHVTTPDNTDAVGKGAWAGAAGGAALGTVIPGIGTVVGATVGFVLGAIFANKATQREPDYSAAYTTAAQTDWNRVGALVTQLVREQFQSRLNELLRCLGQQLEDLERPPSGRQELKLRRELRDLLE